MKVRRSATRIKPSNLPSGLEITQKDVRNEGTSGDVYENTRKWDKMTDFATGYLSETGWFLRIWHYFCTMVAVFLSKKQGTAEVRGSVEVAAFWLPARPLLR